MFTPVSMRSANTYRTVGLETSVAGASPHQLVGLLFDALQQSLASAKASILSGDIPAKGRAVSRAVRILEEGLKAGLDAERGGDLAANLRSLYDYCILKTTEANLRNDATMIDEVIRLIRPISDGWNQIRSEVAVQAHQA
ncbi:MAG: flagellar export chaperone FliS [Rhodoferax sp.]|uniref:flagellar export chaperone FliS n=1 Tax=Rhodoferax sp. TaxID=50421 RepID=UPI002725E0BC|nr:flagellar export chaperone FliS [Rhodoferax sp.]MDO8450749.1 flagellar export chaperone FliS [Rhodoferax sp.]